MGVGVERGGGQVSSSTLRIKSLHRASSAAMALSSLGTCSRRSLFRRRTRAEAAALDVDVVVVVDDDDDDDDDDDVCVTRSSTSSKMYFYSIIDNYRD